MRTVDEGVHDGHGLGEDPGIGVVLSSWTTMKLPVKGVNFLRHMGQSDLGNVLCLYMQKRLRRNLAGCNVQHLEG